MKTLEFPTILKEMELFAQTDTIRREITMLEPSIDLDEIKRQLIETEDMLRLIIRLGVLPLYEDYDIHELLKYVSLDRLLNIQDFLYVMLFLRMERAILQYKIESQRQKIDLGSLLDYFNGLHQHGKLLEYLESKLDPDGQILDDATPQLLKIRHEKSRLQKSLQDKLQKLLSDFSPYLNESVIVMRNERFCIPIKDTYKHKVKGIIHDMSASKQTIYIEPEQTRQITAQIESNRLEEEKEIQRIIALMTDEVHNYSDSLKENLDIYLALELLSCKAQYARKIDAIKPSINKEGVISLIHARHPLLDQKTAVPISLELNDNDRIMLITGPNTGGKTVALKTVGLLTIMMQSGLLVPAKEGTNLAIFDQVFADIGDEQSIMQSLSTFSSHLAKIIQMAENVSTNSLILLDELGSGTDPNEGVSLAIAILNYFKKINLRMMVTTHYSELKSYAYEETHMTTASVAFDKKSLKPLYYLQMGTTGSSHAFLIAKRLGLKDEIILDAQSIYEGRQTDLGRIMEKLNDERVYVERQKEKLLSEQERARHEKMELRKAKETLLREQDDLLAKIREKEERKWEDLKEEVRELIRTLQQKKELSKPELAQLKFQLNQSLPDQTSPLFDDDLKVGDEVFILPYQQQGIIKDIKNDQYRVVFGKFDLSFGAQDLRKDASRVKPKKELRKITSETSNVIEKRGNFELDLRGFRFEEVKDAMDQAIDQAMLSNLHQMRIIHGFGSGAVRKAVYQYIKQSPYIDSSRFGGEGEGLNGVTIITLK
ncbi:MAG: endonuclease MutS2 [Acholeplasmataceae bacterium]|nr:endonuclease MutS2 [Acholeplasmataceae bacterium]